ncbi:MAG: DUF4157 domain-containing protein [Kofleriaceae bacterium]
MSEHDHARAGTLSTPITRNDDLAPGRASKSAAMDAPAHPIVSGLIARKAERDGNGVAEGADHAIATASGSSGMALPSPIMRKFEASLGADLSSVRVHTGAESQSAASAVGAKAYTMGQDIHFGAGHYDPTSGAGEHLLAHEVAHTVQQRGGTPTRQNKLEVSTPFDPAEHEADRAADSMITGRSASVSFGSGVARKVMREPDPGGDAKLPGAPGVAGAAEKGTWHLGDAKLGEGKAGFFEIGLSYSCDVTYEAGSEGSAAGPQASPSPTAPSESKDSYDQKHGAAPASATAGAAASKEEIGIQGEVKKQLDGGFTNFKPSLKGGYTISNKNVNVEVGLEYETKWGPVTIGTAPLTFKFIKWEAGKLPEYAVAGMSVSATIPFTEWESHGKHYQLACQGKFEVEAKPDPLEIGKWVAEHAAELLTAEVLVPTAFIAGGLLTIGAALWQIAKSDELTERTEPEVRKCRAFCVAYQQAMRGEPMVGGEGAAEGYAAGEAHRKDVENTVATPEGGVAEAAKSHDIYADAWNKAWPQVRARMEASYWEEHYIEKALYGPEGTGGGFHVLKMLLDGWDRP